MMHKRDMLVPVHSEAGGEPAGQLQRCTRKPPCAPGSNLPQTEWEIRPVYVVDVYSNDPEYIYKKRTFLTDKERLGIIVYVLVGYDLKGRPLRYFSSYPELWPPHYEGWVSYAIWVNPLTWHGTVFSTLTRKIPDHEVKPKQFSFRWVLRKAR